MKPVYSIFWVLLVGGVGVSLANPIRSPLRQDSTSATNAPAAVRMMPAGGPPPGWGAGVAIIAASSPYRGHDPVVLPIPIVTYVGERFSIMGPKASWRAARVAGISVSAVATYQFAGALSRGGDGYFEGMRDPRGTVEGGVELQTYLPWGCRAQVSAKTDMLGVFDGQELGLSLSRGWMAGPCLISPGVGLSAMSRNLVQYYFGVRPEEARADRPAYAPRGTVSGGPRLMFNWRVSDRVSLFSLCSVDVLGSGITGSPLVDDSVIYSTLTSLAYRF